MNKQELLEDLGRTVTRLRKRKQMSQSTLGELSGSSQMTIQRIESGNGSGLRLETLFGIAEALEVSLADIFFELEREVSGDPQDTYWGKCESKIKELVPSKKEWLSEIVLKIIQGQEVE